jgi:hypothetical protein
MVAAVVRFDGMTEAESGIGIALVLGKVKSVPKLMY